MFRFYFLIVALGFVSMFASAQDSPTGAEEGLRAMKELSFLEGRWEGEGWMRQGPGEPQEFDSTETVEGRLGGRVLAIEGIHSAADSGRIVHHAFGTISHDTAAGVYRFRSHLADGREGDYEARLEDGRLVWGFQAGPGQVRYTIHVDADAWREVGHFSLDGETWNQIFEMNLKRQN